MVYSGRGTAVSSVLPSVFRRYVNLVEGILVTWAPVAVCV